MRAATRGVFSRTLILLTLVAFALSGYVTQTHIHVQSVGGVPVVDLFDGKAAPGKDTPSKNDESNCPLCQAFASAGNFVTPAAAAILLPHFSVSVIQLVPLGAKLIVTASHAWRGRAPPLG
ncbi:MAG TPA: hypothetical protein VJ476_08855 [Rhizomicrobium sp.]|nr:hypothetical protein [Rhizomicrobium sp.]